MGSSIVSFIFKVRDEHPGTYTQAADCRGRVGTDDCARFKLRTSWWVAQNPQSSFRPLNYATDRFL